MAKNGGEGIAAVGMDAPPSVLSKKRQPFFGYFKQLFAQVTNPPIDAIREEIVTSTDDLLHLEKHGDLLEQKEENCKMLRGYQPDPDQYRSSEDQEHERGRIPSSAEIPITYYKNAPARKKPLNICSSK